MSTEGCSLLKTWYAAFESKTWQAHRPARDELSMAKGSNVHICMENTNATHRHAMCVRYDMTPHADRDTPPQWHWMTSILSSKPWRRHQLGGRPEPTSEPLAKVNLHKAAGPDNTPGHGLKKCWKTCSPILVTTPPPSPRDIPDIPRHTHTHYGIPAFNTIFPREMVWTCGTHYIQHWHR